MREIVLDTETTGFKASKGHRVVEIGCVELFNRVATGNVFHVYLNPERDVPAETTAIHGLDNEFLKDKPVFADVFNAFSTFIGDSPIIAHNAPFDFGFLDAEMDRLNVPRIDRARMVDTKAIANQQFPGEKATLDSLCDRFGVDRSNRTLHGALLDAQILSDVYKHLCPLAP